MRSQLAARGATTIRGLGRVFRAMDSFDGNRKVTPSEFLVALNEIGCLCTKAEADVSMVLFLTSSSVSVKGARHRLRRKCQFRRIPDRSESKLQLKMERYTIAPLIDMS